MAERELAFYATPAAMSALPEHPTLAEVPAGEDQLRRCVQGLLVHRDWVSAYGLSPTPARLAEQQLRSTREVLGRAFEISAQTITVARSPADRVVGICRHFALLHTAFLRARGTPARVRCGFANYFDRSKWYDHWITERWDDDRWVREDPQIDEVQAQAIGLDFDPYDQPSGQFLTGSEAWRAVRAGEIDADQCGIFDMWGMAFVAGNVLLDVACLNKVELLPWDAWGLGLRWGPHDELPDEIVRDVDELAALVGSGDFAGLRDRYLTDDDVRVPADITSFVDGKAVPVHLQL